MRAARSEYFANERGWPGNGGGEVCAACGFGMGGGRVPPVRGEPVLSAGPGLRGAVGIVFNLAPRAVYHRNELLPQLH